MNDGTNNFGLHRARALSWCGVLILAGCAAQPPSDQREVEIGNNVRIYDMYDNSRPWGSSYLVGPPGHHDGDQTRIDDMRSTPPAAAAADPADTSNTPDTPVDPKTPPASGGMPSTLTTKPLPDVP